MRFSAMWWFVMTACSGSDRGTEGDASLGGDAMSLVMVHTSRMDGEIEPCG